MKRSFTVSMLSALALSSAIASAQLPFEGFAIRGISLTAADRYQPSTLVRFGQFTATGASAAGSRTIRLIENGTSVNSNNAFTQNLSRIDFEGLSIAPFGNVGHALADQLFFDQGEGIGVNSGNQSGGLQKRVEGAEQIAFGLGGYISASATLFVGRTTVDASATAYFFRNGVQVGQSDIAISNEAAVALSINQPFDEVRIQAIGSTQFSVRGIGLTGADKADAAPSAVRFGFQTLWRNQWFFTSGLTLREVVNGVQVASGNAGQNQAAPEVGSFAFRPFGNAGLSIADVTWSDNGEGLGINSGNQTGNRQKRVDGNEVLEIDFPTYATSNAQIAFGSLSTLPTSVRVEFLFGSVSVGSTTLANVAAQTTYAVSNVLPFNRVRLSVAPSVLP